MCNLHEGVGKTRRGHAQVKRRFCWQDSSDIIAAALPCEVSGGSEGSAVPIRRSIPALVEIKTRAPYKRTKGTWCRYMSSLVKETGFELPSHAGKSGVTRATSRRHAGETGWSAGRTPAESYRIHRERSADHRQLPVGLPGKAKLSCKMLACPGNIHFRTWNRGVPPAGMPTVHKR